MPSELQQSATTFDDRPGGRLRRELGPMARLAWPVVVAELGWMMMGIVDTIVVGPLGAEATGAVGLGSNVYIAVTIFGIGVMLGLDTMVSQEHGAGEDEQARRSLAQGVYLALAISPFLMLGVRGIIPLLSRWGILPEVLRLTVPYLEALTWGTAPLMLFSATRRYLQGVGVVRPITFALVTANLVNLTACWALVYGHLGFRAMGVEGSGWATCLARLYMATLGVLAFAFFAPRGAGGIGPFRRWPGREWARLRRLVALGLPASLQVTLEVGVFAFATTLAGKLDATSLAAHQIVLNVSSLTFMVPLGVAAAGAVRVGQALGRGDGRGAATSGWTAIIIGTAFMTASDLGLVAFAGPIIRTFTGDPRVIETTRSLLLLAAAFQVLDGVQGVATGALRGAGDTRTPMICNLLAHWGIGLPIGYTLAFVMGRGIVGLWLGLAIGLSLAGLANIVVWARRARKLNRGEGLPSVARGPVGLHG